MSGTVDPNSTRPKLKWILLCAALGLIGLIVLTLALQNFVRDAIAVPISYFLWILGILYRSTPQIFFWVIVLIIIVALAFKGMSGVQSVPKQDYNSELNYPKRERVSFWLLQLALARSGYSWVRLADFLGKLALDALAFHYQQPLRQVEHQIETGVLEIPAEMKKFIKARQQFEQSQTTSWFHNLASRIKERLMPQSGFNRFLEHDLEVAINYLEKQLEVSHDRRSH